MIYLYAITEPLDGAAGVTGLAGARVELLSTGGVSGAYSAHEELELTADPDLLWAHEGVVEALMARATVLPLRFGTTLADVAALREALDRGRERYTGLLQRLRGRVELAVRVVDASSPEPESPGDGSRYLADRLATRREGRLAEEQIHAPLARLAAASESAVAPAAGTLLRGAYLVETGEVDRFARRVRELQSGHPDLQVSCTGPWAPYSFVGNGSA